jgi:hypothetical protein
VFSSSTRNFRAWRCARALFLIILAALAFGCGSSQDKVGTAKEVKEEERYRYEGTGKAKQKTLIRRKEERLKELREKAKESGDAAKEGI